MSYIEIDAFSKFHMHQDNVKLTNCVFSGSNADGLIIYSSGQVTIQTCVFTRNRYSFRWNSSPVKITLFDCEFRGNTYGMQGVYSSDVMISECRFIETSSQAALYMLSGGRGTFTVQNSLFQKNYNSIQMNAGYPNATRIRGNMFRNETRGAVMTIYTYETDLLVENNTFSDLPSAAIYVYHYYRRNKHTTIRDNTFLRIKGIQLSIRYADYANVTVEKNLFLNNQPSATVVGIYIQFYDRMSGRISQNEFKNNGGTNVIYVTLSRQSSYSNKLDISSNLFYDNVASQAVIVTSTELCTMTGNLFSNVLSTFDLLVTFDDNNLTAPYNWWGAANEDHVRRRIWDKSGDSNLGLVLYEPFLTKSEMPCSEVANCSGHGVCVRPNMCECQSGWTGLTCNQFTCVDYFNCQNRGVCVGPNLCDCEDGWMDPDCVQASCYDRNNCSEHGICVGPNRYACVKSNCQSKEMPTGINDDESQHNYSNIAFNLKRKFITQLPTITILTERTNSINLRNYI